MVFSSKVGKIYPYLHLILLGACLIWYRLMRPASEVQILVLVSILIYAFLILFFNWLGRRKVISIDDLFFIHAIFDAAIIAIIIHFSGGINSEFYLAFFPVVTLASVISKGWRAYFQAFWYGVCYFIAVLPFSMQPDSVQFFVIRLLSIWLVGIMTFAVARSMRSSESKLLKTLDILNERTWELEKSQVQLGNIYETTRALSGILDLDSLLAGILDVAHRIFRMQKCQVYLSNITADCLYLYASLGNGNMRIFEKPPMHVRDISPLLEVGDRTAMIDSLNSGNRESGADFIDLPLVSRGKVMGILRIVNEKGVQPTGREMHLLMIFANAAAVAIDNSLLHKKTEELTITDALTELYNYRYFRNKLADELRRADRYRQRFSLLMMDLDHFKSVNDVHGHQTGNIVLREVAGILRQCVRDVDIVARYGGEEFIVILPQTGDHDSLAIAERIRHAVEKALFSNADGRREIQITISIGIASYPNGVHTLEQLLEKADKALYKAKSDGRNRICTGEDLKKLADGVIV